MAQLFAGDTISPSPKRAKKTNTCWRWVPDLDAYIGSAPKVATSTIRKALAEYNQYIPISFDGQRAVWVVRHPIDRFRSLHQQKCVEGGRVWANGPEEKRYFLKGMSQEDLMDLIESEEYWNTHWAKQVDLEDGNATEVICIESLDTFWEEQGWGSLPQENACKSQPEKVSKELALRILEYYAEDVELYERGV